MTKIEWTEATWNPIVGCSIVSPGCTNCYAMRMADRLTSMAVRRDGSGNVALRHYVSTTKRVHNERDGHKTVWTGVVNMAPDAILRAPLRRRKPTTYFVNSMGDLFHEDVPDEWIDRVFAVMALAPQHTFQALTKRAARMRAYVNAARGRNAFKTRNWPLPNVWLGVSAEDQRRADERVPELVATPAAVRFVSAEPLLGPINLSSPTLWCIPDHDSGGKLPALSSLDWIIVGGESGSGARPMHPDWARSIRDQCATAGVPYFFKQWGSWTVTYDRDRDDPDWRRCGDAMAANPKGRWLNLAGGHGFHGARVVWATPTPKAAAGRLLDSVTHDAMPERAVA
jgi:protein gp37